MRVHIRDVESIEHPRTGKRRHTIFYEWEKYSARSSQCHTWSDWEASLCKEAKRLGVPVALEVEATAWGPRVQAVSLSQKEEARA